jgi:hypothetical protein
MEQGIGKKRNNNIRSLANLRFFETGGLRIFINGLSFSRVKR